MKPAMKVNGRTIIIICIIVLIILGVLWLLNNNNSKEGLTKSKAKIFADDLISTIETKFNKAGVDINGGKTFADVKDSVPGLLTMLSDIFAKEKDTLYDISFNSDLTSVMDTTTPACTGTTFMYGKKFGDSITNNYKGKLSELNAKCNELTSESCNLTDSCVWVNGKKCMAGDADGPTIKVDNNGKDIDYAYYTYKSECYGSCGSGANYANPCSEFKDDQTEVNIKCLNRMWGQTGCPNTRYINTTVMNSLADYSKAGIKAIFSNAKSEDNYANCYGPNESDWPAPCSLYTKEDSSKVSVRCLTKMYNDTGCDQTDNLITPEFATKNSFKTKGEWINEFISYKTGVNSEGLGDSDFTKCFGPDQSGWPTPCSETDNLSTGLSQRCLTSLFKESGCVPGSSGGLITPSYAVDNKYKTKKEMLTLFKNINARSDDVSFTKCYGTDRSTWPKRSLILGQTSWGQIYFKRSRVPKPGALETSADLIENQPWVLDTTLYQIYMTSITQLPDGSLYGTNFYGNLCIKSKLGDIWQLDPLIPVKSKFLRVRQLTNPAKTLIAVGRNNSLYKIIRDPNYTGNRTPIAEGWEGHNDTCCVTDIVYSDPRANNPAFPYSILGKDDKWIWRRTGFSKYKSPSYAIKRERFKAFILIPNGTLVRKDGTPQMKLLAIGLDGKLAVQETSTVDNGPWKTVDYNNIQLVNIAYIDLDLINNKQKRAIILEDD